MKRLVTMVAIAAVLIGLILLGSSDTAISVADTGASSTDSNIPANEMTTNQAEAGNSSASATITITMYTGDGE